MKPIPEVGIKDTILQNALEDSVCHIILESKKITITQLPFQSDSTIPLSSKKIKQKNLSLIRFIVNNPENYLSNKPVYGEFIPQIEVKYNLKKRIIVLKYDFGLRKWGVFDHEEKCIAMFDLASDDMLRYACQLFPDNTFFSDLLLSRLSSNDFQTN
ncbi:MAG: hypothetical protein J1D77_03220 [Muribaculaceae bacterium]|nr:hypothetical protein [Muribaculaceae bacterium]